MCIRDRVIARIAVAGKDAAGDIAAKPAVAVHIDRFILWQLMEPLPQRVQRYIDKPVDAAAGGLGQGADVEQGHAPVARQRLHIVPEKLPDFAGDYVFAYVAEHIYRVFRAAKGLSLIHI